MLMLALSKLDIASQVFWFISLICMLSIYFSKWYRQAPPSNMKKTFQVCTIIYVILYVMDLIFIAFGL